ncbi:MAG: Uma2 family endonuclease [Chloroflexi bacterium]|nr:Uma2 family endonuclease [Chloroflexota bacterium]
MRTLFVTDPPPPVEDWLERRRALGQDRFDEVWEGEYHVAPAPKRAHGIVDDELAWILRPLAVGAGLVGASGCNIGGPMDLRVPDRAYFRDRADLTWNLTAAIVVEILSPDDEARRKLDFYFGAGVEEVLIVEPDERAVEWLVRGDDAFEPADGSTLLGISADDLRAAIDWPQS